MNCPVCDAQVSRKSPYFMTLEEFKEIVDMLIKTNQMLQALVFSGGEPALHPQLFDFVDESLKPIQMNKKRAGGSGRYKLHVVDWDGDGRLDLLVNSTNADFYRNLKTADGKVVLKNEGPLSQRKLAGHTSSPCTVDWDQDGVRDLIVGAEDGYLYWMKNPNSPQK